MRYYRNPETQEVYGYDPTEDAQLPLIEAAEQAAWKSDYELTVSLDIAMQQGRATRPYVAVWAEDKDRFVKFLVSEGYLRQVPFDPMTGSNKSWKLIMEDALTSVNQTEPGIFDVRSGSEKMSLEGTAYSDW